MCRENDQFTPGDVVGVEGIRQRGKVRRVSGRHIMIDLPKVEKHGSSGTPSLSTPLGFRKITKIQAS